MALSVSRRHFRQCEARLVNGFLYRIKSTPVSVRLPPIRGLKEELTNCDLRW